MEIKRVLLINCSLDKISREKIKNQVSSPNLGLLSIASVLIMHGYNIKILDFFANPISVEEYNSVLKTFNPDVIGFSVYTRTMPFLKRIVKKTNSLEYKGIYVAGGPHASFAVEEMLNELEVDYVIRGEGEFTFLKLLESLQYPQLLQLDKIDGISYKKESQVINNNDVKNIDILDALPLQPIGLINPKDYSSPLTLITSRGCPGHCIYCASRTLSGCRYRMRTAENIICEIIFLSQKLHTNKFIVLDDTFTANESRVMRFCGLLKRIEDKFVFRIESRVDSVNHEIIDLLKSVNCEVIHFGIESGSQEVINQIGKGIDLNWAVYIMKYAMEQSIHVVASFIIGHYCDNEATVRETIEFLKDLKEIGIEVSIAACTPFPGTPLYINRKKLGVEIYASSWQEYDFGNVIISTKHLTQDRLRELLYEAVLEIV